MVKLFAKCLVVMEEFATFAENIDTQNGNKEVNTYRDSNATIDKPRRTDTSWRSD